MERSHRPRSAELMRIIASLVSHVGRVRRVQRLADEGVRARDAAAQLKMHPFAAEKAFAQAANFSADELNDAIVRLAELDARAKGGSRLPADVELERALVDVTRPRERAPAERYLSPETMRAACDLRRAAVFLCSAPRDAARSSQRTSSRWRSVTAALSPSSAASRRRRISVFAVERQRRFSPRCRVA
jgi:hypothetical protein